MTKYLGKIKNIDYNKFKPAVHKKYLMITSGLMWSGVGIFLISLANKWLHNINGIMIYYLLGFLFALIIHRFGFIKIARQNVNRILNMKKTKVCFFAFQQWKSYGIIVIMMSLGMYMRNSFIPKNYLAVLYFSIGGALFLSSIKYYSTYFINSGAKNI